MARKRADADKTLLCAVKFWSGYGSPGSPFYKNPKLASSFRRAVRSVARKQDFTPAELTSAERRLIKKGLLERAGSKLHPQLKLTSRGMRTSCRSVKLSPWTDDPYPGSRLEGSRSSNVVLIGAIAAAILGAGLLLTNRA